MASAPAALAAPAGSIENCRAAQGIVHGCGECRRGGGLIGAHDEVDAEFLKNPAGGGKRIGKAGNRRALITADVADAALQQGLGNR